MLATYHVTESVDFTKLPTRFLKEMDDRDGLQRISNAEVEAFIALYAGANVALGAQDVLRKLVRRKHVRPSIAAGVGIIAHCCREISAGIPRHQRKAIMNNTDNVNVTVSQSFVKGCVNVDLADMKTICRAAMESHCDLCCTLTGQAERECPLRRAFDTVPGLENNDRAELIGGCPYRFRGVL